MWALFSENVCKNERIGSHRGGVCWARPLDLPMYCHSHVGHTCMCLCSTQIHAAKPCSNFCPSVHLSVVLVQRHWQIRGLRQCANRHPNGTQLFHFRVRYCQKAPVSEVGTPLQAGPRPQQEILHPPLLKCHTFSAQQSIRTKVCSYFIDAFKCNTLNEH